MATLTIRNVPTSVHASLRRIAKKHRRSLEAEIRAILTSIAAAEMGQGLGQQLHAQFSDVYGDELSELRDQSPVEGAVFK